MYVDYIDLELKTKQEQNEEWPRINNSFSGGQPWNNSWVFWKISRFFLNLNLPKQTLNIFRELIRVLTVFFSLKMKNKFLFYQQVYTQ